MNSVNRMPGGAVDPAHAVDAAERDDDRAAPSDASKNFCGSPVSARTMNSVITEDVLDALLQREADDVVRSSVDHHPPEVQQDLQHQARRS